MEYSDDRVNSILSHPNANLLHFLSKAVRQAIVKPKDKINWQTTEDRTTESYDINLSNSEGDSYTLKDTFADESEQYNEIDQELHIEAADTLGEMDRAFYLHNKVDSWSTRKIAGAYSVTQTKVAVSIRESLVIVTAYLTQPHILAKRNKN